MCKYDLVRCHSLSLKIISTQLNKKKKKVKRKRNDRNIGGWYTTSVMTIDIGLNTDGEMSIYNGNYIIKTLVNNTYNRYTTYDLLLYESLPLFSL